MMMRSKSVCGSSVRKISVKEKVVSPKRRFRGERCTHCLTNDPGIQHKTPTITLKHITKNNTLESIITEAHIYLSQGLVMDCLTQSTDWVWVKMKNIFFQIFLLCWDWGEDKVRRAFISEAVNFRKDTASGDKQANDHFVFYFKQRNSLNCQN